MMTTIHVTYARVRISFLLSYTDLIDVRRVAAQTDRLIDRSTTAGARTEVRPGLVTRVFYGTDEPAPWTTQMRNGRERLAWALQGSTNSSALPKVKKKKKEQKKEGKKRVEWEWEWDARQPTPSGQSSSTGCGFHAGIYQSSSSSSSPSHSHATVPY